MGKYKVIDGNEAWAHISYMFTEIAGIYPITPASPMSEYIDKRLIIIDNVKFNEKVDILIKIERTNKKQILSKINEILF